MAAAMSRAIRIRIYMAVGGSIGSALPPRKRSERNRNVFWKVGAAEGNPPSNTNFASQRRSQLGRPALKSSFNRSTIWRSVFGNG